MEKDFRQTTALRTLHLFCQFLLFQLLLELVCLLTDLYLLGAFAWIPIIFHLFLVPTIISLFYALISLHPDSFVENYNHLIALYSFIIQCLFTSYLSYCPLLLPIYHFVFYALPFICSMGFNLDWKSSALVACSVLALQLLHALVYWRWDKVSILSTVLVNIVLVLTSFLHETARRVTFLQAKDTQRYSIAFWWSPSILLPPTNNIFWKIEPLQDVWTFLSAFICNSLT